MRLIDADAFKQYCIKGMEEMKKYFKTDEGLKLAIETTESFLKDIDEQPTATQTCENINEDYAECDQFKCSECQIELQDWHRVERDEYDGEISYHEYTFKYCPNCGRRVKEEDAE